MQWLKEKVLHLQEVGTFLYLSQLEVSLNLGKFGQVLDSIGNQISQRLVEYGMSAVEPFVFGTLHLAQDPLKQSVPKPGVFGIERRRDVPYAENRFFAQAPLRTEDHKVLLTTLEGVLR